MADSEPATDVFPEFEEEDWASPITSVSSEPAANCRSPIKAGSEKSSRGCISTDHRSTIIHFDIDCFYAQVEMLRNPDLRDKPLGIQQKNIVVTCNYEARKYGVTKLMYISDATKKCPKLILVSGEDLTNYRHYSYHISEFFKKYTPNVERLGFDENFVDVTQLVEWRLNDNDYVTQFNGYVYGNHEEENINSKCMCGCEVRLQIGSQIAADIRNTLHIELGITCCAGIAHNKVLSKLVAGINKPNQQTTILPHLGPSLMLSLPSPRCIPGIGSKMFKQLQRIGILSIRDLQLANSSVLHKEFGSQQGTLMSQLAFGSDPSQVIPYSPPQTLSDEDSFKCCKDYKDAEQRVKDLLTSLLKRILEDGRTPQTVRLAIRRVGKHSNSRESRQTAIPHNVFSKFHTTGLTENPVNGLLPIVMNLFKKMVDPNKMFHLTLINVCFAKLNCPDTSPGSLHHFFTPVDVSSEICEQTCLDTHNELPSTGTLSKNRFTDNEGNEQQSKPVTTSLTSNISEFLGDSTQNSISTNSPRKDKERTSEEECSFLENTNDQGSLVSIHETSTAVTYDESMKLKGLRDILPADIDIDIVMQLPLSIQKEILGQHGIVVQELPEGMNYTVMPPTISTRSRAVKKAPLFSKKRSFRSLKGSHPESKSKTSEPSISDWQEQNDTKKPKLERHEVFQASVSKVSVPNRICSTNVVLNAHSSQKISNSTDDDLICRRVIQEGKSHGTAVSNQQIIDQHNSDWCSDEQIVTDYHSKEQPFLNHHSSDRKEHTSSDCHRQEQIISDCYKIKPTISDCVSKERTISDCHRMEQTVSDCVRKERTISDSHKMEQRISDCHKKEQIISDCHKKEQTISNCHIKEQNISDCHEKEQTISDCHIMEQTISVCHNKEKIISDSHRSEQTIRGLHSKEQPVLAHCVEEKSVSDSYHEQALSDKLHKTFKASRDLDNEQTQASRSVIKDSFLPLSINKLPDDINPQVFLALPRDIQGEIMAHVMMGTPLTIPGGNTSTTSSSPKQVSNKKKTSSTQKVKGSTSGTQRSLLSYFTKEDTSK